MRAGERTIRDTVLGSAFIVWIAGLAWIATQDHPSPASFLFVLFWPAAIPLLLAALRSLPVTEEARLRRRVAAARRARRLIELRALAEVEEVETRELFDRFVSSDPELVRLAVHRARLDQYRSTP